MRDDSTLNLLTWFSSWPDTEGQRGPSDRTFGSSQLYWQQVSWCLSWFCVRGFWRIPLFLLISKALNRQYEEYVLTVGDFDERIFLDADADEEIGTPRKSLCWPAGIGTGQATSAQAQLQHHVEKVNCGMSQSSCWRTCKCSMLTERRWC